MYTLHDKHSLPLCRVAALFYNVITLWTRSGIISYSHNSLKILHIYKHQFMSFHPCINSVAEWIYEFEHHFAMNSIFQFYFISILLQRYFVWYWVVDTWPSINQRYIVKPSLWRAPIIQLIMEVTNWAEDTGSKPRWR